MGGSMLAAMMMVAPSIAKAQAVAANGVEAVTVTGYAASLQKATDAKRQSPNFTDSVFAEDIGKFPDNNIAESLNRIPGVTILRDSDGEGVNVPIRGLGTNFTKILLNGAQIAVASTGADRPAEQQPRSRPEHVPHGIVHPVDGQQEPTADHARRRRRRHREHAQRPSLRQARFPCHRSFQGSDIPKPQHG